jgi:hypothetical protein
VWHRYELEITIRALSHINAAAVSNVYVILQR